MPTLTVIAQQFQPHLHPQVIGRDVLLHDQPVSADSQPTYLLLHEPARIIDLRAERVLRFASRDHLDTYVTGGATSPADWAPLTDDEREAAQDVTQESQARQT